MIYYKEKSNLKEDKLAKEKGRVKQLADKILELMHSGVNYKVGTNLREVKETLEEGGYVSDRDFFDAILYLLEKERIKEVVLTPRNYQRLEPRRHDKDTIIGFGIVKAVVKPES